MIEAFRAWTYLINGNNACLKSKHLYLSYRQRKYHISKWWNKAQQFELPLILNTSHVFIHSGVNDRRRGSFLNCGIIIAHPAFVDTVKTIILYWGWKVSAKELWWSNTGWLRLTTEAFTLHHIAQPTNPLNSLILWIHHLLFTAS